MDADSFHRQAKVTYLVGKVSQNGALFPVGQESNTLEKNFGNRYKVWVVVCFINKDITVKGGELTGTYLQAEVLFDSP